MSVTRAQQPTIQKAYISFTALKSTLAENVAYLWISRRH